MSDNNIINIGRVELTKKEAFNLYEQQKYIVTHSNIYQLHYSQAQECVYGQVIYRGRGLTRRGRFFALSGTEVNRLIGCQIVNE